MADREQTRIVVALGTAQTIGFASSYYLPAIIAVPMARDLGLSTPMVFAAFSAALVISAWFGPASGRWIDRHGGRGILSAANGVFAIGLSTLALAHHPAVMALGWLIVGIGMSIGLYEAAFSTLAAHYGDKARNAITGVTLIAGFASTIGWPLTSLFEAEWGWRGACLAWAALHLSVALALNWFCLPSGARFHRPAAEATEAADAARPDPGTRHAMIVIGTVFALVYFTSTAMAAHLPRLLEAAGASATAAIAAAALVGPAQVAARLFEFGLMRRFHPLVSARLSTLTHPLGVLAMAVIGAPAASLFTMLHGAGNGVLTISKGTLPLVMFGPHGYGHRQGLLSVPARITQALAPVLFGLLMEWLGARSLWITSGIGILAFALLMTLKPAAR